MKIYVGQVFYKNGEKYEIIKTDFYEQIIIAKKYYSTDLTLIDLDREEVEKLIITQTEGVE